jgi:hypothetical protein
MIRDRRPIGRPAPAVTTLVAAMGARIRKRLPVALALVAAGAFAATAAAGGIATVYSNDFSTAGDGHQLRGVFGKKCNKKVNNGSLEVKVKGGPQVCGYGLPVEGESSQPAHSLQARMKLLRITPRHLRKPAYVGLQVRSGGGTDYELRIFPKGHRYLLKRTPHGSGFPLSGKDGAIKSVNQLNTLRLRAFGHVVKAWVNGSKLGAVSDSSASDVRGRHANLVFANRRHTDKDVLARADDVRLSVPKP